MVAYRRGDYKRALKESDGLRIGPYVTAAYYFFRGGMLFQLGAFVEAEARLREALRLEENARLRALVFGQLGTIVLEQQRFDEAISFFEDSIRAFPDRGGAHRGIAEVRLRQGRELGEALNRAEKAVSMDQKVSGLDGEAGSINVAEDLGVLAWAVAEVTHNQADVERLLGEAFPLCGTLSVPMLAKLHYHAGESYKALRAADKVLEHLRKSAEVDPQGIFGRMASSKIAN